MISNPFADPIQAHYEDPIAICYGCGRNNEHGHRIQTFWDGEQGVCRFKPKAHHTAFPGVVYGGLIASLIDCHSIATAVAAAYEAEGRAPGSEPHIRFVTANLNVTFLKPTPLGGELVLKAKIKERHARKAVVTCSLYAEDAECARGEVVAVPMPAGFMD